MLRFHFRYSCEPWAYDRLVVNEIQYWEKINLTQLFQKITDLFFLVYPHNFSLPKLEKYVIIINHRGLITGLGVYKV